jgi:hypothetical protein
MKITLMVSVIPSTATVVVLVGVWLAPAAFGGGGSPPHTHHTPQPRS